LLAAAGTDGSATGGANDGVGKSVADPAGGNGIDWVEDGGVVTAALGSGADAAAGLGSGVCGRGCAVRARAVSAVGAGPVRAAAGGVEGRDEGGGAAGCSAGRVTVPGRLKFWSSRGPTVSGAGVLVVAEFVLCASAGVWPGTIPAANIANIKRKPALIVSRSCHEARRSRAREAAHGRVRASLQA
jgi:hypothetical protein